MKFRVRNRAALLIILSLCLPFPVYAQTKASPNISNISIHLIGQSHIDLAWRWPWWEAQDVIYHTFAQAVHFMQKDPSFRYTQSSAAMFNFIRKAHPRLFKQIQTEVKKGRFELVGGSWVEPDLNMPSGEALVRQFLLGQDFFRKWFHVTCRIGWNPDGFGTPASFAQILAGADMNRYVFIRCPQKAPDFWWLGPADTRVLAYNPTRYLPDMDVLAASFKRFDIPKVFDGIRSISHTLGTHELLFPIGVGDHGGGPTEAMLAPFKLLSKLPGGPKVKMDTVADSLNALLKDKPDRPSFAGEFEFQFPGTYTSHADIKRHNRRVEAMLTAAEAADSFACQLGHYPYPAKELRKDWQRTCFNQFHDILSGTAIHQAYQAPLLYYLETERDLNRQLVSSLNFLAARCDTTGAGQPIVVFNPLSFQRSDIVQVQLDYDRLPTRIQITDAKGRATPGQVVLQEKVYEAFQRCKILFVAHNVPAGGLKVFWITAYDQDGSILPVRGHLSVPPSVTYSRGTILKNTYYHNPSPIAPIPDAGVQAGFGPDGLITMSNRKWQLTIDPKSGNVTSLFDKKNNRQVLSGNGGDRLVLLGDNSGGYTAWNIKWTGEKIPLDHPSSVKIIESGPVRAMVRVKYRLNGSRYQKDIALYSGLNRIETGFYADWRERLHTLKLYWSLNLQNGVFTRQIPYGHITHPTDGTEVPGQQWVDESTPQYGVSLMTTDKYGYDANQNVLGLTLLRSSTDPDPDPDVGLQCSMSALLPHSSTWRQAGTDAQAAQLNVPLLAVIEPPHPGILGRSFTFCRDNASNVQITAIKRAENGNGWIYRLFETNGVKRTDLKLTFPWRPRRVWQCNLLEDNLRPLKIVGKSVTLPITANQLTTVRVIF